MNDKPSISVVWFKRDLRLSDHEPLKRAVETGLPIVLLYIFEPMLLDDLHYSERHWRFVTESLTDMNRRLKQHKAKVSVAHASAESVFNQLFQNFNIVSVYSHQEVGLANTFERDVQLVRWFKNKGIEWRESQYAAVLRGSKTRDKWDQHWKDIMRRSIVNTPIEQAMYQHVVFDTQRLSKE